MWLMGPLLQFCNKDSVLFPAKDLWGGGSETGGLFSYLVFRGRPQTTPAICVLLGSLGSLLRICEPWSWRDQVGVGLENRPQVTQ